MEDRHTYMVNTNKMLMVGVYETLDKALDAIPTDQDNYYLCDPERLITSKAITDKDLSKLADQFDVKVTDTMRQHRSLVVERIFAAWQEQPVGIRLRKGTHYGRRGK